MRETIEFRIPERHAREYLPDDAGVVLGGTVRKLELAPGDPLLERVRAADEELRARGDAFFTFGHTTRRYTRAELEAAELLHLELTAVFEPAGEESGTVYDDGPACPVCGAGRRQVGDLVLDRRRIPRGKDLARTIADELIVSTRLAELLERERITGVALRSVQDVRGGEIEGWRRLVPDGEPVPTAPPTRFGVNVFDDDERGEYRCPLGHVKGLNLLSEVSVPRGSWSGRDLVATSDLVGVWRGLLRPAPLLLASPRLARLLADAGAKGYRLEVAHLV